MKVIVNYYCFDDNVGVTITSHQKLTINSYDDIISNFRIELKLLLLCFKTGGE